jgi:hypothetical protein
MKLGTAAALTAEAALWLSGAALIASAAGMSWNVDLSSLVSSQASASASVSPSAGPSATVAVQSLAPGASPTISPVVAKFQAINSQPNLQYKAKVLITETGTVGTLPLKVTASGTMLSAGGDNSFSYRLTENGKVTTYNEIDLGDYFYQSVNGGSWTKAARSDSTSSSETTEVERPFSSTLVSFADQGIETKNGAQLHRLVFTDQSAFNSYTQKSFGSDVTASGFTLTVWVNDDGTPADMVMQGSLTATVSGKKLDATMTEDLRIFALSGVSITAPI